jgi:mono/diheme cytochrome c family protein
MFSVCVSGERMKIYLLEALVLMLASGCSAAGSAPDGAALYRSKCLACHGADGAGRPALQGTNLMTAEVQKASDADLTEAIARGGKKKLASHAYETKGLKPADIQALVKYVRMLQSKQKS